jgi:ribonuclease D
MKGLPLADWIDRTEPLLELMPHAPASFGLDTEFMRISTFFPRLALIQVAFGERIALVDPLADVALDALGDVLADPQRIVVMHSASEDLEALATRFPRGIAQLFDTQIASAFAGLGAGLGYQKLVSQMLGVDLPKAETRSDWTRRPLSPQQIEYAEHDVVHLPALHVALARRVGQRGYTDWLVEDCARLVDRARTREPDPEPQTQLRGAADWAIDRQALLRRVLRWRELTARRTDTPRPWILDDATALDLAYRAPTDAGELSARTKAVRGLRSPLRAELLELLRRPLEDEDRQFEAIPRAPSLREKPVLAAMKEVIAARAKELDLPEGLIAARRHLEALLVTHRWPKALEGWRRGVLHDALVALLP